jgi:flagellar basal-body rod protein FlgG
MTDTVQAISRSLSADIATLNAISHNVANINTPGFRAERSVPSFQSQLEGTNTNLNVNVIRDLADGPVSDTGRPLDLALHGHGFFVVERDGAKVLTRSGQFHLDSEGMLVNLRGERVLGEGGPLHLDNERVKIDGKGAITDGDRALGQLQLVDIGDPAQLVALDGGDFRYDGVLTDWTGSLHQGSIEHANVDAAGESIRLMELTRHVESVQHAIGIYDKAMDTGINRLGEN